MEFLIPLPNASGGRHIYNAPITKDGWQLMSRLDTQLTERQRLFGRVFYDKNELVNTNGLPVLHSEVAYVTWNTAVNHTHILSPKLVNAFQFTYSETDLDRGPLPVGDNLNFQKMGVNVPLATKGTESTLVPLFRGGVSNHWSLNQDAWEPDDRPAVQFKNDMSYTRGSHVLKFGGEYRWSANNRTAGNCNDPCFNFNGQYTGQPLGDFLIGRSSSLEQFSVRYNKGRAKAFATYLQDDWQVRRDVTLSLGVRWEPFIAFYEVDQPQPVFRPGEKSTIFPNAPLGLLYAGDPGVPRGGHPTKWAQHRAAHGGGVAPQSENESSNGLWHLPRHGAVLPLSEDAGVHAALFDQPDDERRAVQRPVQERAESVSVHAARFVGGISRPISTSCRCA